MTDLTRLGPLKIALDHQMVVSALADHETVSIDIDGTAVPLLIPLKIMTWFNQDFFGRNHEIQSERIFYVNQYLLDSEKDIDLVYSLGLGLWPGRFLVTQTFDRHVGRIGSILQRAADRVGTTIRRVPLLGTDDALEDFFEISLDIPEAPTDGASLTSWQDMFESDVELRRYQDSIRIISDPDSTSIDSLLALYENCMRPLSDGHPIRAELDLEVLSTILATGNACIIAKWVERNPVALLLVVSDIALLDWLEPSYFSASYPGQFLNIPAIATAPTARGVTHSASLASVLTRLTILSVRKGVMAFSCNNESRRYTPRIVRRALERTCRDAALSLSHTYVYSGWRVG